MGDKTMDFKIYPARVEGERELMNKPLKLDDHKFLYKPDNGILEAGFMLSDIQSAKRGFKQEIDRFKELSREQRAEIFVILAYWFQIDDYQEVAKPDAGEMSQCDHKVKSLQAQSGRKNLTHKVHAVWDAEVNGMIMEVNIKESKGDD